LIYLEPASIFWIWRSSAINNDGFLRRRISAINMTIEVITDKERSDLITPKQIIINIEVSGKVVCQSSKRDRKTGGDDKDRGRRCRSGHCVRRELI